MNHRAALIPLVALTLGLAACGDDTTSQALADRTPSTVPVSDTSPDTTPPTPPADVPPTAPADGTSAPVESDTVSGRVVGVDRDGPSVDIVETTIVTGDEATAAARADGKIGPDEEWEVDFYVVEGARRWLDLDPNTSVAVYDCTQACEHVAGTLEHVLSGAPYGGSSAMWVFELLDGRAVGAEEIYTP